MTECKDCGASLVGQHVTPKEDGPFDATDRVPSPWANDHPHFDEKVAYVVCPGCSREVELTVAEYHNPPEEL